VNQPTYHSRSVLVSLASLFGFRMPSVPAAPRRAYPHRYYTRWWSPRSAYDRPRPPPPGRVAFRGPLLDEALRSRSGYDTTFRALCLASDMTREQVRRVKQMARVAGKSPARYLLDLAAEG
jgi:hypothetical protein